MRIEDTKKEPEIAEMIEGSEGDRRRLSELLDGIRVGPGVDAMADEMREVVWADVRLRIRRRGLRMRIARYAAAAAVMVGVICGSWFMGGLRVENRLVAEAHPVVISTPRGVKSDVILPDGSRVRLNGGTRIVYLTLFGDQRRVEVDGEAYFEVELLSREKSLRRCSVRPSTCMLIPRTKITRSHWRRAACWWTVDANRGAYGCGPASRDSSNAPPGCCRCAG